MMTIQLPFKLKYPLLACGADVKAAFVLAAKDKAFLFPMPGDIADPDNFARFQREVKKKARELRIAPRIIVSDLHPGYYSTRFAEIYAAQDPARTLIKVQHHRSHIGSVMLDNRIREKVIGVAFDGTGYGEDGAIWGGEWFTGTMAGLTRAAHLGYTPMPATDLAIREPWRMALSYLLGVFADDLPKIQLLKGIPKRDLALYKKIYDKGINAVPTSSAGRLFDAVGSIVFARTTAVKEAELPIALEKMVEPGITDMYDFDIVGSSGGMTVDVAKTVKGVVQDVIKEKDPGLVSTKFHNSVAAMIHEVSLEIRRKSRIRTVVLSGGVFQNRYLAARSQELLARSGFEAYLHHAVPTSDVGIPLGQLALAHAMLR